MVDLAHIWRTSNLCGMVDGIKQLSEFNALQRRF